MQRNTLPRILTGLLLWLASSLSFHNSIIQQNGPRKLSRRGLNADTKLSVLPNSGFFLGDSNVGIDLEALQRAIESPGTALDSSTSTLTSLALLATGVSVFLYDQRPVGSCREDLVDVRRSQYIKGGLGVMAKTFIPKGTIIGKYPGYKKSQDRFKYGSKYTIMRNRGFLQYIYTFPMNVHRVQRRVRRQSKNLHLATRRRYSHRPHR